jgi:hypothetical protein
MVYLVKQKLKVYKKRVFFVILSYIADFDAL